MLLATLACHPSTLAFTLCLVSPEYQLTGPVVNLAKSTADLIVSKLSYPLSSRLEITESASAPKGFIM